MMCIPHVQCEFELFGNLLNKIYNFFQIFLQDPNFGLFKNRLFDISFMTLTIVCCVFSWEREIDK